MMLKKSQLQLGNSHFLTANKITSAVFRILVLYTQKKYEQFLHVVALELTNWHFD